MSWTSGRGPSYRARVVPSDGGNSFWELVREATQGESDREWVRLSGPVAIDEPGDFARAVEPGVVVEIDYSRFCLRVRREPDDRVYYRAVRDEVSGRETLDGEHALWSLLDALGEGGAPRACFFCKWSDVESGTGWGHLGCFRERKAEYEAYVSRPNVLLKWVTSLGCEWVDEWHGCEEFTLRPRGYGYRGRR